MNKPSIKIENNPAQRRFEAKIGDDIASVEYILGKDYIVFAHTEVPQAFEGKGIASQLAQTALEYAKDHQLEVMPLCPYFAAYMRRHPEYQSLLRKGFHV